METEKQRFIALYQQHIKREGGVALLDFLEKQSDFFKAPASTRYHLARPGGLLTHSLNVYDCLVDYLARKRAQEVYGLAVSDETTAVVSLLHDVCKINCYLPGFRNVKDEQGVWQKVPSYDYNDTLPYGHGEKSVYIISGFMRLSREESFAIRYHMGFAGDEDKRRVGESFKRFPLAFALSTADMEATYFMEKE